MREGRASQCSAPVSRDFIARESCPLQHSGSESIFNKLNLAANMTALRQTLRYAIGNSHCMHTYAVST